MSIVRELRLTRDSLSSRQCETHRAVDSERETSITRPLSLSRQPFNFSSLFPYQIDGVRWLSGVRRGLLADAPGLGKSAQLLRAAVDVPLVVVCPAMLEGVWFAQAKKWRPDLTVRSEPGKAPKIGCLDVYSYDYRGTLPSPHHATFILDEIHYLRHREIARSSRWAYLASTSPENVRIWGATGTPVVSYKDDFAGVLEALGLMHPVVLRRDESDVDIQLPKRVYDSVPVTIGHDLYHVLSVLDARWAELDRSKLPPLSMMTTARVQLARAKTDAAIDWARRYSDERLIVYSNYIDPLREIARRLDGWGLVTGDIPIDERNAIIDRFEQGHYRGLVCSIGAVGVGVTIVSPKRMLFIDRDWSPGVNDQVEKRIARISQQAPRVFITDLIADHPLEERVYEILAVKRRDAELVYDLCS